MLYRTNEQILEIRDREYWERTIRVKYRSNEKLPYRVIMHTNEIDGAGCKNLGYFPSESDAENCRQEEINKRLL